MRFTGFSAFATLLLSAGCAADAVAPAANRTFPLTATVTASNGCAVTLMGKNYQSAGKVRGDVPAKFIGTIADKSHHGFGCIVDNPGGEGDLIIIFSGNHFQQPLSVGTYQLATEILDGTPAMRANVSFRSSTIEADRLATFDGARGSVVVDSTADGGRRIRADVDVFLYNRAAF